MENQTPRALGTVHISCSVKAEFSNCLLILTEFGCKRSIRTEWRKFFVWISAIFVWCRKTNSSHWVIRSGLHDQPPSRATYSCQKRRVWKKEQYCCDRFFNYWFSFLCRRSARDRQQVRVAANRYQVVGGRGKTGRVRRGGSPWQLNLQIRKYYIFKAFILIAFKFWFPDFFVC